MMSEELALWRDCTLAHLRRLRRPDVNSGDPWSGRRKADIADAIKRGFAAMALLEEVLPALDAALEGPRAFAERVRSEIGRILGTGRFVTDTPPPPVT